MLAHFLARLVIQLGILVVPARTLGDSRRGNATGIFHVLEQLALGFAGAGLRISLLVLNRAQSN